MRQIQAPGDPNAVTQQSTRCKVHLSEHVGLRTTAGFVPGILNTLSRIQDLGWGGLSSWLAFAPSQPQTEGSFYAHWVHGTQH